MVAQFTSDVVGLKGRYGNLVHQAALSARVNGRSDSVAGMTRAQRAEHEAQVISDGRRDLNARVINMNLTGDPNGRSDNFDASVGFFQARELEYINQEVLREVRADITFMDCFAINTRVPFGAELYTVQRVYGASQAQWSGGGTQIKNTGLNKKEESFKIRGIENAWEWTVHDQAASQFAGASLDTHLAEECADSFPRLMNTSAWLGAPEVGIHGVVNYPWLNKITSPVSFDAATATTNPELLYRELCKAAAYNADRSFGKFYPTAIALSIRVYHVLTQYDYKTGTTAPMSILDRFLQANPRIKEVKIIPELQDVAEYGGDGIDGIFFFRDNDPLSVEVVVPRMATALPGQWHGTKMVTPMFAAFGGVNMKNIGNNLMLIVPA